MREIEAIREHLESQPADWAARQMLADLYEDMGDADRARFQRWLVRWKRHAERCDRMSRWHPPHHLYWWKNRYMEDHWEGHKCPSHVGETLPWRIGFYENGGYDSHQEAEETLLTSLCQRNWPDPT